MAEEVSLPAPKNSLVTAMRKVLDYLIQGLGAKLAIAAGYANGPAWLAYPVLRSIYEGLVNAIAEVIDERLADNLSVIIIRFQNDGRLAEYEEAAKLMREKETISDAEYEDWKARARRIVNRNRE